MDDISDGGPWGFIGATFSSGMMEVARKGIFHPDMFMFSDIMVIFLAVMITDIILLDMFNTLGMPTSTTVSIVFELLGSAVAVSLVKIKSMGSSMGELSNYINSEKALAIITGILVSVIIAFTIGALVQYITRLVFSFNYRRNMKYFGSIFGGFAITAITYFILIKGIDGSAFAGIKVANGLRLDDWVAG
jgi:phosphate/sulfate permease